MLTESLIGLPSYMQEKYAMEKQAAKTGGVVEWVKNLLRKTRDTRITSPSPSTDKARLEWSSLPAAIPYMSLGGVAGGIAADDDSKAEGALLGALGGLPGGLVAHYGGRELARDGRLSHAMVQALAATLSGGGGAALGGTGDLKERAKQALIGAGMGLGVRGGREAAIELGARVPAGIGGMTSLLTTPPLGVAGGIAGQELARKIVGEKDKLPPPPVDSGIMLPPPVPRLALT
jgi:hypothetical protein